MWFELDCGTLYIMDSNGRPLELGNISNGIIEMDTLSADETPNVYYNFTKGISASFEVPIRDVDFLDEFTIKQPLPKETFNIEHNIPILAQARWHKKKRINKRWLKRYGMKADTVKIKAKARTLSYNTETGECEFEVDKFEYIWRPDQLRKYLKIEM